MAISKSDAVYQILEYSEKKDRKIVETALQNLQEVDDGLTKDQIEELVNVLTTNTLASALRVKLLSCLVPETMVSEKALSDLLSWFFSEIGTGKISKSLEKQFIHWITGIVHYELGDITVIESYYHSFLFLLRMAHMEAIISKLLCLLVKPEDAKHWTVKKILDIQKKSGPKAHTNCLLSILKSYRPDVVPENVPMIRMNYENSPFNDKFRRAHERKIQSTDCTRNESIINVTWNKNKIYDKKSSQLARLIPSVEKVNLELPAVLQSEKVSVTNIKNMVSLGVHCLNIEIPAQTLSLLSNIAGFHVLAFSDSVTKSRFCHKLSHTLFRVFILELEPYSTAEKTKFLESIVDLEEYIQQGVPVVTDFLLHYLLIWDGEEFRKQIFNLLQWVVIKNEKDLQEYFFRPLRQIFRSSGVHCKYLLLEALGCLVRNVIAFHARREGLFVDDLSDYNAGRTIKDIVTFASELIVEGLVWNRETGRRNILTAALNFYEVCSVIEYSLEFPVVLIMPPALVYGCLFSGSRVCLARLCSLLIRFWLNTIEKVLNTGNIEEFNVEIQQANIYMVDFYRCLWSNTDFQPSKDSFLFHHKGLSKLFWEFQNVLGVNLKKIFAVDNNFTFWDGEDNLSQASQNIFDGLAKEYPSILTLKQICEERIL